MHAPRCDQTSAWTDLQAHFDREGRKLDLRTAFAEQEGRAAEWAVQAPEVFADLSKNHWDVQTRALLVRLAHEVGLEARRDAMFAGEAINPTEGRAVLHTALRAPQGQAPFSDEVHQVLDHMLDWVEQIRDVATSGIRHVVNIGIGGSDLGPQMLVPALEAYVHRGIQFHFVSNVDGHDLAPVLARLNPRETLFIVASKTFTTQETMANANLARTWFLESYGDNGEAAIARHFVGTTTNLDAAAKFGIHTTFGFWDWVGGRFSLWSAIGLPVALAIGAENFRALLAGAHAMDRHFAETPLERNLPALLGLLDVWYRNFHRYTSRSVAPYHQGLRRLPAYLQQLEMESNGKTVGRDGQPLSCQANPIVWGEIGSNGQHAFFQLLHQGGWLVPSDFIASAQSDFPLPGHQAPLMANFLAQSAALAFGKTEAEARSELEAAGVPADQMAALLPHKVFAGNQPSTTIILPRLDPFHLGMLMALYEHKVFVQGVVWGINSFDQWGVELGKQLAGRLLPALQGVGDTVGLDQSTRELIAWCREHGDF